MHSDLTTTAAFIESKFVAFACIVNQGSRISTLVEESRIPRELSRLETAADPTGLDRRQRIRGNFHG